jgi:uncharacterized protein (TIGR03435 family)
MYRVALFITFLTLMCCFARAQNSQAPLKFEVASVRPASAAADPTQVGICRGGPGGSPPGRLECLGAPLKMLVFFAYGVQPYQVIGPAWANSALYDITANVPQGVTRDRMKLMLKSLLEDRFHLAAHLETRQQPVYSLEAVKGGLKLKESVDESAAPTASSPSGQMTLDSNGLPEFPENGPGGIAFGTRDGHTRVKASKQPLAQLVKVLTNLSGRPVIDNTGLTGKYGFYLDFVPDTPAAGAIANAEAVSGELPDLPGLFTALQEQLGLRLRSAKGPIEVLVIDKADRSPTEND